MVIKGKLQDLLLSSDGGETFATPMATKLEGAMRSYAWLVLGDFATGKKYRIGVVARDAAGNVGADTSDANFKIR